MAATGNAVFALRNADSEGRPPHPPPRRAHESEASGAASSPVAQLLARRVALALVTACPRFAQRLHGAFVDSREIALRVQPVPEGPVSVHRLACDCSAGVLVVDAALFEIGRVLPGDAAVDHGKGFHLMLAFPSVDRSSVDLALRTRAQGCMEFDIPVNQFARAIAALVIGDLWFPRWMARCFYERAMATAQSAPPDTTEPAESGALLTHRELEVMHLLRRGLTNKEIGRELCISPNTVKKHVHGALQKLGLIHRRQAF